MGSWIGSPSARRRSMSATSCENDKNSTSAWARVVSSSIVMLNSLQYWPASVSIFSLSSNVVEDYLQYFIKLDKRENSKSATGSGVEVSTHFNQVSKNHVSV